MPRSVRSPGFPRATTARKVGSPPVGKRGRAAPARAQSPKASTRSTGVATREHRGSGHGLEGVASTLWATGDQVSTRRRARFSKAPSRGGERARAGAGASNGGSGRELHPRPGAISKAGHVKASTREATGDQVASSTRAGRGLEGSCVAGSTRASAGRATMRELVGADASRRQPRRRRRRARLGGPRNGDQSRARSRAHGLPERFRHNERHSRV